MVGGDPAGEPSERSVGGFDRAGRLWVLGLFGAGGVAVGVLLPLLASWVGGLPWAPFQGPLQLLGSFDQPWLVWARPSIGLAAGLGLAAWIILSSPVLTVDRERIQVRRRGQVERVIKSGTVAAVYPRGSKTVIETDTGRTVFEDDVEGDKAAVRDAFMDFGYPWEGPAE